MFLLPDEWNFGRTINRTLRDHFRRAMACDCPRKPQKTRPGVRNTSTGISFTSLSDKHDGERTILNVSMIKQKSSKLNWYKRK